MFSLLSLYFRNGEITFKNRGRLPSQIEVTDSGCSKGQILMLLTAQQSEMLDGKHGYPVQKAMEILVGLAECYDARRLIPIKSVHLAVNNVFGAGEIGMAFVRDLTDKGGKFVTFADTNSVSAPYDNWKDIGIFEKWAHKQAELTANYARMGAFLGNTCTPYMIGHVPRFGEHIAWSETSATVFANAVFGARTNRESGPSSIASALTGFTPDYGFHQDQNRYGDLEIAVRVELKDIKDFAVLGYFAGKMAEDRVPVFIGIPTTASWDDLAMLCAACATTGSIAHFHAVGITPEAPTRQAAFGGKEPGPSLKFEFGPRELKQMEEIINNAHSSEVDLIILGCPHYSIAAIQRVSCLLMGKKLRTEVWILTSQVVKSYAQIMGYISIIEAAGGRVLGGACQNMMPPGFFNEHGYYTVATNSPRLVFYEGLQNMLCHFGTEEKCLEAALNGIWR
jgi:predicted aconitase